MDNLMLAVFVGSSIYFRVNSLALFISDEANKGVKIAFGLILLSATYFIFV